MAEGRRSSRAHKAVNYAKLDYGSDEDDDFKPAEAPPSKRSKPSAKEAPAKKPEKKLKSDTTGATAESSTADQKQKAGRASLDDKLFQRDLEVALRLSQNGPPPHVEVHEAGGSEHNSGDTSAEQNGMATFPDHLELAGEVVVQSEPPKNADEFTPHEDEEEDYQPEQEDGSKEECDPSSDDSDEDSDSSDDDEEFAPTKAKVVRSSRKEPAPKKSPATKKPAGPTRATISKAAAPPVVPCTTTKASTPARAKAQPSTSSAVSPAAKSSPRPTTAAKSSPRITSRPLPQRSTPSGGVPMTVPKFLTGQLPASGIRLGLSRRSFSKPLHSAVKVLQ